MTDIPLKLGFIGLGIMGAPMCGHLIAAGHQLFVHTRGKVAPAIAQSSATQCTTARGVAERADIVFLMLPDTPDVEKVLFGADGVAAGLKNGGGKVVVDMSSISPVATKDFAHRIEALGARYLDAPVSGGEVGAKNATLSIMVGGPDAVFERVKPLFEKMGKNITLVGGNGDGQTAKVANQIIVARNIEAVAEALLGGFASSKILEVHAERMIRRTFEPGFRIALHQKDLNLALSAAKELGVALPNTAGAQQLFSACVAHGGAGWDHSGMVRALEVMANFEVGQKA
jgi:2-hydroxy-3-oxopropionate reductase